MPAASRAVSTRRLAAARRRIVDWFRNQGWSPFRFQRQAWNAWLEGKSGLIHATTGTGKTYAAWMGPLIEALAQQQSHPQSERAGRPRRRQQMEPLHVLWITPLRALAADTAQALTAPLRDLDIPWSVETRTSDTPASVRTRQRTRLPTVLVTTPESLSVMLSHPDAAEHFNSLRAIVVDEWHELLSTKRGVQAELVLARLRAWQPDLRIWGLSATLGNLDQAMETLLARPVRSGTLIEGRQQKPIRIRSLIPATIERFPWAGHMGLRLVDDVATRIDSAGTALVFTNTRSQTESWYQALLKTHPEWAGRIALHHGSIAPDTRRWVEDQLQHGRLKCVVCTSSLDLGVDFSPVDRVIQIGSPKGVARLMQRAGRSGHAPGPTSHMTCVPTHAPELVEFAAVQDAIAAGHLESRPPGTQCVDVLCQHALTLDCGSGFRADELLNELRSTAAYRSLHPDDWDWVLDYITRGGEALRAYPDYRKAQQIGDIYRLPDPRLARQHRLSIGTIVSEGALTVQYLKGPQLGTIEESFLAKLKPGDVFIFAGRLLELVQISDSRVWVRRARQAGSGRFPRWMGGRMPLSTQLANAVRARLDAAARGQFDGPEMTAVRPLLELQRSVSRIPRTGELLIEQTTSREGWHTYVYPFAGRLVHEGLAALFAWRISRLTPITFSISVNDYGFELLSPVRPPLQQALTKRLLESDSLRDDISHCVNSVEMGRRQFREIAHIAGLVFPGYPGSRKSARQLQASTNLLYDVFSNYDPDNLLLAQARREVLERQFELTRLRSTLDELSRCRVMFTPTERFTPLAFPLLVDRLRERLSSERLADRVRRLQQQLDPQ